MTTTCLPTLKNANKKEMIIGNITIINDTITTQ